MTQRRSYKQYPKEFKEEAVALITEQGYIPLLKQQKPWV
jgi:transposase